MLKVKYLKKILVSYNEKVTGNKADLVLRAYSVFSRTTDASTKEDIKIQSTSNDSPACTYKDIYCSCQNILQGSCHSRLWWIVLVLNALALLVLVWVDLETGTMWVADQA